jgi:glycosyltransferase involved in cell wall biosynthesis
MSRTDLPGEERDAPSGATVDAPEREGAPELGDLPAAVAKAEAEADACASAAPAERGASLRVALLVDPVTVRTKGLSHAPALAGELLGRGHVVRGFGAPPGVIPHSGALAGTGEDGAEDDAGASDRVGLDRFAPDAIVAYDALSPASWLGARVARRRGTALVLVEGGIPASAIRLHERFLQSLGERLWGRYVRDTCTAVVALDPVARNAALEVGFAEEQVRVLPEGVDPLRFRPGLSSAVIARRRIGGRVCLYAGPLELSRGLEVLVRAFAATVGQREDWCLVLAGDGGAAGRLRVLADRLGVGARVHLLPRARPEEHSARGRQVARAMACGLPVIASATERLRFFVEDDGNGLLAEPGDLASWTAALGRAAGAPQARVRWGQRGLELSRERFAWPVVAEAFEEILGSASAGEQHAEELPD